MTQEESIALLIAANEQKNIGKFAPKLSFTQRCEVLALFRIGCSRELLHKLYKVDRRTITHIYNPKSPHYKNVREEELRLGRENFIKEYATADVTAAAYSLLAATKDEGNNKNANKKRGVHNLQNEYCNSPHRVIIQWHEVDYDKNIQVAGWYYQDLDSEWPNDWFHGDAESLRTSQACYAHAQKDISDPL
jgi:hypothetical protein